MKPPDHRDMRFLTKILMGIAGILLSALFIKGGLWIMGIELMFNASASGPIGIWAVDPSGRHRAHSGDMVIACPPPSLVVSMVLQKKALPKGDCPSGSGTLLKRVVATSGDLVTIKKGRLLTVNGVKLPNSRPTDQFPPWPDGTYTVHPAEVWLVSSWHPHSFDSRYFGPVRRKSILGLATPILVVDPPTPILEESSP